MLIKKKLFFLLSTTLIFTLSLGTLTHAAAKPISDNPTDNTKQVRYAILDGISYGITFGSDGNAYCHASGSAGNATKFVVSGTFHKYGSNGRLDQICNWPDRTIYGQNFIFDEHALMVTPGEYLFTLYVDVYNGSQRESLVFYKNKTKN